MLRAIMGVCLGLTFITGVLALLLGLTLGWVWPIYVPAALVVTLVVLMGLDILVDALEQLL